MNDLPILRARGLNKHFGGVHAVEDFDLDVQAGQIVGLIGPNGSGKTTVFNLITGVVPCDDGRIHLLSREITGWKPHDIARAGVGRTFQNLRLFEGLSVMDNVKTALCHRATYSFASGLLGNARVRQVERELTDRGRDLLLRVGLNQVVDEKPQNLPYGLQRRLELARALAVDPRLLLLDEPAAGLNPSEVQDTVALIRRLRDELGIAILLIEHHMDVVMPICSEVYVLNMGATIAHGAPREIQKNHEVLRAYLGE